MEYLVNAEQMKKYDTITIQDYGVPSLVLMERAALAVVTELESGFDLSKVLVACGSGNNGGDGFAIARLLHLKKIPVTVVFAGKEEALTEETRIQKNICENYGMNILKKWESTEYTCIVDAIFGIGLSRTVTGAYAELITRINESGAKVLAVDIPSGISADTGKIMGSAVEADMTVTFAFRKIGQVLHPGTRWCGRTIVADIGIAVDPEKYGVPDVYSITAKDKGMLPVRKAYSNKGSYGKALIIAGQKNMCGAAVLAAEAAYRMGTGLVQCMTEECNRTIIQSVLPEALLTTYEAETAVSALKKVIGWGTAIAMGPGIGMNQDKEQILKCLLSEAEVPLVLDADALNLLGKDREQLKKCKGSVVLTPHVGEMVRLTGLTKEEILSDILAACRNFAKEYRVICILKDTRTIISDGETVCINQSGCNGMATGGSGDVLSGILTGLLAQGMPPFKASALAVYLHGRAGETAEEKKGNRGMLAGDIVKAIPTQIITDYKGGEKHERL